MNENGWFFIKDEEPQSRRGDLNGEPRFASLGTDLLVVDISKFVLILGGTQ